MLVFGTEMHLVTLIFIILEVIMFFYQLVYYLYRPEDKNRFWYLTLLFLLITYNITGGLFPDPNINMPIVTQNILAYGSGFLMASYFPFYFYKGFELKTLRFHAIYGVPLFLLMPFIVFFVIAYSINRNLDIAIKYGVIIPFFYSLVLLWAITKAVIIKYRDRTNRKDLIEVIAVYCAVFPWASMTALSYFHVSQLVEVVVTNGGFIVISILFISRSITNARLEYQRLLELDSNGNGTSLFEENCKLYQLTCREMEIVRLVREGHTYKTIGEALFISERTVRTHVQNIFLKVEAKNKVDLLNKLGENRNPSTISA